jgi:hypothetical protein
VKAKDASADMRRWHPIICINGARSIIFTDRTTIRHRWCATCVRRHPHTERLISAGCPGGGVVAMLLGQQDFKHNSRKWRRKPHYAAIDAALDRTDSISIELTSAAARRLLQIPPTMNRRLACGPHPSALIIFADRSRVDAVVAVYREDHVLARNRLTKDVGHFHGALVTAQH